MRRRAQDPTLWLRTRQALNSLGAPVNLFSRYRTFVMGADKVLRTPGLSHEDKVLMLRARVAHASDRSGLDRRVLVKLLNDVLTFRLDQPAGY